MKDSKIKNFLDLHTTVQDFGKSAVYRGERKIDNQLKPKVGRYKKLHSLDFEKKKKRF